MPIRIECPYCDASLEAPNDIVGRKVKCKNCGDNFRVHPEMVEEEIDETPSLVDSASKPRPPASLDDEDEDERPAKSTSKSRPPAGLNDDDDDARASQRSGKASKRRKEKDEDARDEEKERPSRRSREGDDEAEEPRPQKKKGRRKRKAGNPVVLLLVIGIGALVLIGVIGAFYSGGGQQDGAAAKGGPVSGPGADAGADGAAAGDASVPGWLEFSDPNGQYKVRMPRLPAAPTKQHWPIPNGNPAEATVYTVEIGGGVYSVAYLVIPGRDAKAPVDPVLDDAISGGMAWFSGAAIKSRTNITHQGFTGRQVVLEYPGVKGSSVLRVIIAGNRMFWVMAKGDNFSADSPKVIGFLNSLKIN